MVAALQAGEQIGPFIIESCIGSGSFASVWRARHSQAPHRVAITVLGRPGLSTPLARTRLQREVAFLKRMDHPFIAKFFQMIEDDRNVYLVMEFVEHGNLLEYVNENGRLSEDQARRYFAELLSALEYLHREQRVAHRDLKCENVLLDRYNNIRLIDFGLSNQFTDLNPTLRTACGSPAYAAPEMVQGHTYTSHADIWSSGILLFAIVAGYLPFDDEQVMCVLQKIVYSEVRYPSFMSPQLVDLLQKMLCKEPDRRITIDMIKVHPWFSQSQYQVLKEATSSEGAECGQRPEGRVQKEIIDEMTASGVDCHNLLHSLMFGEFTDTTALYGIFVRNRETEKMKNLMETMLQYSSSMRGPGNVPRPRALPAIMRPILGGGAAGLPRPSVAVPTAAGRRGSRPVAVKGTFAAVPRGHPGGAYEA
jgi:serine/threonine protein kinase